MKYRVGDITVEIERGAGVVVVDLPADDSADGRFLRFIFEDTTTYMYAAMKGKRSDPTVIKCGTVYVDESLDELEAAAAPQPAADAEGDEVDSDAPAPGEQRCADCGNRGELTGHQDCLYPGRSEGGRR